MINQLTKIKKVAIEKEDENWKFRTYLKICDYSMEEIDSMVHKLFQEISSKIDCKTCANCCKEIQPLLDAEDIKKLSKYLNMSVDQFTDLYVIKYDDWEAPTFNKKPCPFLKDNSCSCYDCRPKECSSFPYLHKERFSCRLTGVIENYAICPIVFNVYERLKNQIWR